MLKYRISCQFCDKPPTFLTLRRAFFILKTLQESAFAKSENSYRSIFLPQGFEEAKANVWNMQENIGAHG